MSLLWAPDLCIPPSPREIPLDCSSIFSSPYAKSISRVSILVTSILVFTTEQAGNPKTLLSKLPWVYGIHHQILLIYLLIAPQIWPHLLYHHHLPKLPMQPITMATLPPREPAGSHLGLLSLHSTRAWHGSWFPVDGDQISGQNGPKCLKRFCSRYLHSKKISVVSEQLSQIKINQSIGNVVRGLATRLYCDRW